MKIWLIINFDYFENGICVPTVMKDDFVNVSLPKEIGTIACPKTVLDS